MIMNKPMQSMQPMKPMASGSMGFRPPEGQTSAPDPRNPGPMNGMSSPLPANGIGGGLPPMNGTGGMPPMMNAMGGMPPPMNGTGGMQPPPPMNGGGLPGGGSGPFIPDGSGYPAGGGVMPTSGAIGPPPRLRFGGNGRPGHPMMQTQPPPPAWGGGMPPGAQSFFEMLFGGGRPTR